MMGTCRRCGRTTFSIQRHHVIPLAIIRTMRACFPITDDLKISLCPECHKKIHEEVRPHTKIWNVLKTKARSISDADKFNKLIKYAKRIQLEM